MIKLKELLNEDVSPKGWNMSKKYIKFIEREVKNLKKYHRQQNGEDFLEVANYIELQLKQMKKDLNESINEGSPKYGKLKLTKEKPKKISQRIWSAPKRIMTKRAWLRMPDMNKMRKNGVDYVATSIGPKKTQVYIPVIFEND